MEEQLKSELIKIPEQLDSTDGDSSWTLLLKVLLTELGKDRGFKICASGVSEAHSGEWLYDLIWYREDHADRLSELILTVESEWSLRFHEIKYDFEKLLVAHAPLKLMVFQDAGATADSVVQKLCAGVEAYEMKDDAVYLFAGYRWDKKQFQFWRYGSCLLGTTGSTESSAQNA